MDVIVWQSRDNRLFSVNVKWLWRLASTNNCAWLEHFSSVSHLNTWGVYEVSAFAPFVPHHKTLEIQLQSAQFTAAVCFCLNDGWNCLDKWLYLTERSLFVCFCSKYCHKIWLSNGKMRNSMQAVKQPIPVFHWIFPDKRNNALLIDWATHFPCIKVFAVWGAQFVSALVNRLKAAAGP